MASHAIAKAAFRPAIGFLVFAAAWWVVNPEQWWTALHAFLAGTVLMAISGATQLFTITWAASPPPGRLLAGSQRWTLAVGVAMVLWGVIHAIASVAVIGAVAIGVGLGLLAVLLVGSIRRSLLRRFDLATRFYLVAIAVGAIGVALAVMMVIGRAGSLYETVRLVHAHLNVLGLVGLVILGTLPTILPTFAHHRVVSGREATAGFVLGVVAVGSMIAGLVLGPPAVAAGSIVWSVAAGLVLVGIHARLGWSKVWWSALPGLMVTSGVTWIAGWSLLGGVLLARGAPPLLGRGTAVVAIAGIAQVLLGSLAYLLPVLAGPGERLVANRERMRRWWALPLVMANGGGVALVAGLDTVAVIAIGAWVADFLLRAGLVAWSTRAV